MIQAMLIKKVGKLLASQFKLAKLLAYVEDPNDADERIDELELNVYHQSKLIKRLEENSHPPRDFVMCDICKQKIEEK